MIQPILLESYTVTDFETWKDDWELIQGKPLTRTPSPNVLQQQLAVGRARWLDETLDACPECQVLYEMDWALDEETVVPPELVESATWRRASASLGHRS